MESATQHSKPERNLWKPFQKLNSAADMERAARLGAIGGVLLIILCAAPALILLMTRPEVASSPQGQEVLMLCGVFSALAFFLTLWIWSRKSLWAQILVACWVLFELSSLYARPNIPGLAVTLAILIAINFAILGLRGSFFLGRHRRISASAGASG